MPFFPVILLFFLVLIPLLFLNALTIALTKLGIDPLWAPWLLLGMFIGSLVNIPVFREPTSEPLPHHKVGNRYAQRFLPQMQQQLMERIVAINVGGCVIPTLLVLYEIRRIWDFHPDMLQPLTIAILANILVCYFTARPIPQFGIAIPLLLPGFVAAGSAFLLAPTLASPVAFSAGVLGPLIGADLMHLRKFRVMQAGITSIGGAGTFDGIVMSGLIAVLLT